MNSPPPNVQPLGDFKPADFWQTHVNAIFYGIQGPGIHNHFQTFVSRDHRLAHALADEFFDSVVKRRGDPKPLHVMEWGIGNGNLAGSFLSRLKERDTEGAVYPRLRYTLCDFSDEILTGAKAHPKLQDHLGQTDFLKANAEIHQETETGWVDQIISNEIWDDLATKVLVKHDGMFFEEFLQPCLDPSVIPLPLETFLDHFQSKDLDALKTLPPFLDHIHWERSFQRVDLDDWPHADTLKQHLESIDEEIPVPINVGAIPTLDRAKRLLNENAIGYTGFDYGMLGRQELNAVGRPYFRLYGGQYTNMVNFPLLKAIGEKLGFNDIRLEPQQEYVGRVSGQKVVSAVDLVQTHPNIRRLDPWDVDMLMIQTLDALNRAYKSPYRQKLDYPAVAGTPKKQRKRLAELVKNLSRTGVPDTVAYVTYEEIQNAFPGLKKLGYRDRDLLAAFESPPSPIAFARLHFKTTP